ncbi:ABC transporter permease [Micromonospora tarensis]|uniref:Transport permease protein n=1 Tax=Micromonospora tarensis TaxID=2806100 RepID=A0ABS1YAJ4_9ACTN|nr:ABC transporter permease [Micromonospora tarensis]MBM0274418.1 ABC transporter permease [Micromonospora tarensis]
MVDTVQPVRTGPAPSATAWHGSGVGTQIVILAGRAVRPVFLRPSRLVVSLIQPFVMLGLFSQVFRSMADTPLFPPDVSYINYLVPAILFTTATTVSAQAGVGMTSDMRNGVLARFRSMPVRTFSVLTARSIADLARGALELTVMIIMALLIFGFDPPGGLLGTAVAMLLALAVGWSLGWLFLALATWLRGSENVQACGILITMLLQFASSAFVPVASMPTYLRAVATVNPLSYGIDAARGLILGRPVGTSVVGTLAICLVLSAVCSVLAARGLDRTGR